MPRSRLSPTGLAVIAGLLAVSTQAATRPKVVIIGFDGADARLVQRWMDEGELPNLAKLRDEGTFAPLQPTNPPQTPVSWSSFATGTNPGKTRIQDWLRRDPSTYFPDIAMVTESKRPFAFGSRTPILAALLAAALTALVALALLSIGSLGWRVRLIVAVLAGIAPGIVVDRLVARYVPQEVPAAINNRTGATMWELASRAGKRVQVIRVPATFPADDVGDGHMISGLGVPDIRGTIGTPSYYTSDPRFDENAAGGEFKAELVRLKDRRGRIDTHVVGPANKPFYNYVVDRRVAGITEPKARDNARREARRQLDDEDIPRSFNLPMTLDARDDTLVVTVSGQSQTLRVGGWSDWFALDFPVNPLADRIVPLRGMARFKLLRLSPEIELYMSPINFHPDCHPVAFAWPPAYSETIAKRFGLYKTIGWPEDTWALPSGVGDENLFLEDAAFTVAKDEEIMKGLLGDHADDLYIQIYYFTDRVGHLFWRFIDPGHPLYNASAAGKYGPEVLKAYERMDQLVGTARVLAGPDAIFIVCSDHGFSSFRRGVNLNTWLVRNGLMTLKGGGESRASLETLFDTRNFFGNVDWSKTKAYALGLGSVYVNLVGREREGIVMPGAEYDDVCGRIKTGLESLIDEKTGDHPVSHVWTRDEMYTGYEPRETPDLRVGNTLNYRVSWQTSLGAIPRDVLEDNASVWSGDHCSNDPDLVRGVFFCNRRINNPHPSILDVAPTVLKLLGVEPSKEMEGKPLL